MKLSEQILSLVNSISIAYEEAGECRMERDRVGQLKAERLAKEYRNELTELLVKVNKLEKESHQLIS